MPSRAVLKIALFLALILPSFVSAEDVLQRPGWRLRIWRNGGIVYSPRSAGDADSEEKLGEGVKLLPGSEMQFDASEWWRNLGVIIPDGGLAIFDKASGAMMMFAPNDVIDLAEQFIGGGDYTTLDLLLEVSLVECVLPPGSGHEGLSYDDLHKAAGKTWLERERVAVRAHSGQRLVIERVARKLTVKREPVLRENEAFEPLAVGADRFSVELEPNLGPDGSTFDLNLAISHSGPTGVDGPALKSSAEASLKIPDGQPVVVKTWAVGPAIEKGTRRRMALIVRPRVVNCGGWPVITRKP